MALRVIRGAIGAAMLRPSVTTAQRLRPAAPAALASTQSTPTVSSAEPTATRDPKQKAQLLIDALPGSNLLSKTAILSSAAGVSIWALSNEYYVFNEESVVAICLTSVWVGIFKYLGPLYTKWADDSIAHMTKVLVDARDRHKAMVQDRIDAIRPLSGVVDITKTLFEVSKETAQLEAQAFGLEQKTQVAAEAKATLDSWVRYEGQVKAQQQKDLAAKVIANVRKELQNPKVLQQVLQMSVEDVERILTSKSQ